MTQHTEGLIGGVVAPALVAEGPDPQLVDLFDRYLVVLADATRRFGNLFPYNHLRMRILGMLAHRTARVLIRDEAGVIAAVFDIEWRDGEFRRVAASGEPALSWVLDQQMLEQVAAAPWVYLAHPRRLSFAWFQSSDALKPAASAPSSTPEPRRTAVRA